MLYFSCTFSLPLLFKSPILPPLSSLLANEFASHLIENQKESEENFKRSHHIYLPSCIYALCPAFSHYSRGTTGAPSEVYPHHMHSRSCIFSPTPTTSLYSISSVFLFAGFFPSVLQHIPIFKKLLLTLLTLLAIALFLSFSSQQNSLSSSYTPRLIHLPFSLELISAKLLSWPLYWNCSFQDVQWPIFSPHLTVTQLITLPSLKHFFHLVLGHSPCEHSSYFTGYFFLVFSTSSTQNSMCGLVDRFIPSYTLNTSQGRSQFPLIIWVQAISLSRFCIQEISTNSVPPERLVFSSFLLVCTAQVPECLEAPSPITWEEKE